MTLSTTIALFSAMVVLAITPGPGIVVVIAQTVAGSLRHGISTIVGVVLGDFIYVACVLLGLAAVNATTQSALLWLNIFGGCYLIYLGGASLRTSTAPQSSVPVKQPSYAASFLVGLLTTLGNPKVIFFYISFLPAFLNLDELAGSDIFILLLSIALAVGGVMFGYAYLAEKAKRGTSGLQAPAWIRYCSSFLLILCGLYLLARLI